MGRRTLLMAGGVLGAAGAPTLAPVGLRSTGHSHGGPPKARASGRSRRLAAARTGIRLTPGGVRAGRPT
jgi:hypothetical protein